MKQEKIICFDNKYNSYAALGPITAVSIGGADDNSLLACGSTNGVVNIWDIRYNYQKSCKQLVGHTGRITNISWLINDEIIRTSATDGTIRFWDSLSGQSINTIHMYSNHTGLDSMCISSFSPQQELLQLHRLQSKLLNKYYGILSTEESDDDDDVAEDERVDSKQETLCFMGVKSFNGNKRAFKLQL
jgi:WD40 repeat protein